MSTRTRRRISAACIGIAAVVVVIALAVPHDFAHPGKVLACGLISLAGSVVYQVSSRMGRR